MAPDEVFCPECGHFVETLASGEEEVVGVECPVCQHEFDYISVEDSDADENSDKEEYDELKDLDFGDGEED